MQYSCKYDFECHKLFCTMLLAKKNRYIFVCTMITNIFARRGYFGPLSSIYGEQSGPKTLGWQRQIISPYVVLSLSCNVNNSVLN